MWTRMMLWLVRMGMLMRWRWMGVMMGWMLMRMTRHYSIGTYNGRYRSTIILKVLLVLWLPLKYTFGSVEKSCHPHQHLMARENEARQLPRPATRLRIFAGVQGACNIIYISKGISYAGAGTRA